MDEASPGFVVVDILNRWRQFGRRYFWANLLFGVIAASFGMYSSLPGTADNIVLSGIFPKLSHQNKNSANFNGIALLYNTRRHSSFDRDYWPQHALSTVVRHLSFSPQGIYGGSQEESAFELLQLQQLILFYALLVHESTTFAIVSDIELPVLTALVLYDPGLWLAKVQGIRAGPGDLI